MFEAHNLRQLFPEGSFGPPSSEVQIVDAERALGHKLPPLLDELYRSFDGFTGPTGAQFLYSLLVTPGVMSTSLVVHTRFLRSENYLPPFLQRVVALGDTGVGPCWLMEIDHPRRLLWWDAEWGDDYEVVSCGLLDAWVRAKEHYHSLSGRT